MCKWTAFKPAMGQSLVCKHTLCWLYVDTITFFCNFHWWMKSFKTCKLLFQINIFANLAKFCKMPFLTTVFLQKWIPDNFFFSKFANCHSWQALWKLLFWAIFCKLLFPTRFFANFAYCSFWFFFGKLSFFKVFLLFKTSFNKFGQLLFRVEVVMVFWYLLLWLWDFLKKLIRTTWKSDFIDFHSLSPWSKV